MWKKIRHIVPESVAGLEIRSNGDETEFYFVLLKRSGAKISIGEKQRLESLLLLQKKLGKKIPLFAAITGKGILNRFVIIDPSASTEQAFRKVLPDASPEDFFCKCVQATQGRKFISVIRRSMVDEWLKQLIELKIGICACSIGPASVLSLACINFGSGNKFVIPEYELIIDDGHIDEISSNESNQAGNYFRFGEEQLEMNYAVATSVALQQFGVLPFEAKAEIADLKITAGNFRKQKYLRQIFTRYAAGLLLVLLCNFFFFSHYRAKQNGLQQQLDERGGALTQIQEMEGRLQVKKKFLEKTGFMDDICHSWYADRIASSIPDEIELTAMNFSPKIKTENEDSVAFDHGQLKIDGNCTQSLVLNNWIHVLESKNWFRGISVHSFVQDKSMSQGEFSLIVTM